MTAHKYERIPPREEANWIILSIQSINGIEAQLNNFPMVGEEKGCCASLIWSGISGSNVPVHLVETNSRLEFGIVLDATHLSVPQADLLAWHSYGEIAREFTKQGSQWSDDNSSGFYTTKYPNKKLYNRYGAMGTLPTTNLARNEHIEGKKESIYHDQGSAEVFAKNIWRKYFHVKNTPLKEAIMRTNEAVVFQEGTVNPIIGLFITHACTEAGAKALAPLLEKNKHLKLYLYDKNANEHIVRYLNNTEAQEFVRGFQSNSFKEKFPLATPYAGMPEQYKDTNAIIAPISSQLSPPTTVPGKQLLENLVITTDAVGMQPDSFISGNTRATNLQTPSISWDVLNGFMIALGVVTVVVAFVALNASSGNALGAVMAVAGIGIAGIGLFGHFSYKKLIQEAGDHASAPTSKNLCGIC